MEFKNKKVVITGGAKGIGKQIVQEFKKRGAKIAVIDKDDNEIECDVFYKGDISKEENLIKFSKRVIEKFRKIDYLINNACLSKKGLISNCSFDDFNYVLKAGVTAPYILTNSFLIFKVNIDSSSRLFSIA